MHFHSIAIILGLTTAALSAPVSGIKGYGPEITESCRDFRMRDTVLVGSCWNEKYRKVLRTLIFTKPLFGVSNGQVQWGAKNWWSAKIEDPEFDPKTVTIIFKVINDNGAIVEVTVRLADHIKNIGGYLTYVA